MIIVGNLVGLAFALVVLAISVVYCPMVVHGRAEAYEAVRTSVRVTMRNPGTVLLWGVIVALLLFIGCALAFVGLAVVLPVLGYATWHIYTRAGERGGIDRVVCDAYIQLMSSIEVGGERIKTRIGRAQVGIRVTKATIG